MKKAHRSEAACRLCAHAVLLENPEHCLCAKHGVVYSYGSCRRYRPDLLKFAPENRPTNVFSEDTD